MLLLLSPQKIRCGVSNNQADRLGDELKDSLPNINQLRQLDAFRQSFSEAYGTVYHRLTHTLNLQVTGRPVKSTTSIVEKLRREKMRLSQMQDIAGCRIVVDTVAKQDQLAAKICLILGSEITHDRRRQPSHGYRAIHVIASISGRPIEVQIRSHLQHLWAELSEKFADIFGATIKYGQGEPKILSLLNQLSNIVGTVEGRELLHAQTNNMKRTGNRFTKRHFQLISASAPRMRKERASVQDLLNEMRDLASSMSGAV